MSAIHLEGDDRMFPDIIVLHAFFRAMKIQVNDAVDHFDAEVQRKDVRNFCSVESDATDVGRFHDLYLLIEISHFAGSSSHQDQC